MSMQHRCRHPSVSRKTIAILWRGCLFGPLFSSFCLLSCYCSCCWACACAYCCGGRGRKQRRGPSPATGRGCTRNRGQAQAQTTIPEAPAGALGYTGQALEAKHLQVQRRRRKGFPNHPQRRTDPHHIINLLGIQRLRQASRPQKRRLPRQANIPVARARTADVRPSAQALVRADTFVGASYAVQGGPLPGRRRSHLSTLSIRIACPVVG